MTIATVDTKNLYNPSIPWHHNSHGLRYLGSCRISSIQSYCHSASRPSI